MDIAILQTQHVVVSGLLFAGTLGLFIRLLRQGRMEIPYASILRACVLLGFPFVLYSLPTFPFQASIVRLTFAGLSGGLFVALLLTSSRLRQQRLATLRQVVDGRADNPLVEEIKRDVIRPEIQRLEKMRGQAQKEKELLAQKEDSLEQLEDALQDLKEDLAEKETALKALQAELEAKEAMLRRKEGDLVDLELSLDRKAKKVDDAQEKARERKAELRLREDRVEEERDVVDVLRRKLDREWAQIRQREEELDRERKDVLARRKEQEKKAWRQRRA